MTTMQDIKITSKLINVIVEKLISNELCYLVLLHMTQGMQITLKIIVSPRTVHRPIAVTDKCHLKTLHTLHMKRVVATEIMVKILSEFESFNFNSLLLI